MLCILGDILNYGSRKPNTRSIDPKGIVERLNSMKDSIVAVRGNCDAEVDQMLLQFPVMADYAPSLWMRACAFSSRTGIYIMRKNLPVGRHDIFVLWTHPSGGSLNRRHTAWSATSVPSLSPKGGNEPTFAVYEHSTLTIHRLDGTVLKRLSL